MNQITRRGVTAACLAVGLAASVFSTQALAEWTPPGPIKLMIAFAAGGGADTQARLIAEEMENRLGWKVIPEQVTGKGGTVLANAMLKEPSDGTSIGMVVTETLGYNAVASKNKNLSLDNFTMLSTTAGFQMGIVALSKSDFNSWEKVKAQAKAGKQIRFGAMSPRLADLTYHLGLKNGIDFNIVLLKGGKAVMNALNAGDIDIGWGAGIQTKAVKAGDMVNIASGIPEKLAASPDAPLLTSLGSEFTAEGHFLFIAPAGMPAEARAAYANAIKSIAEDPSTKAGALIQRAFGGAAILQGDELDKVMLNGVVDAGKLMKAVSN